VVMAATRSASLGYSKLPITRMRHQNETGAYRPDIDGLRAVSILLVVGYHAQPWLVPGGFIGVDIFFVISGFLITRIILSRIKTNTFSFMEFYARRIRRIFPALIVVLAVTYLIGWFVLLPDGFSMLGKSIAAGVAFVSNLFQLGQAGYFAPDATENPLLHLWSLGIEEQFYIFWPPALLIMFGSKRHRIWMAVIAAASFGVSLMIFFRLQGLVVLLANIESVGIAGRRHCRQRLYRGLGTQNTTLCPT
jgi:peptidoglycan/LPS O-acetylase OafA/YrhL